MQKNSGEKNKGRMVLKTNFDLNVAAKSRRNIGWWILSAFLAIVLFIGAGYFITQACSLSSDSNEDSTDSNSPAEKK